MLRMQVYSERTSIANGITTNVGEDAHPFVNNAGMFVADGMGGSAGVPVISLDDRCFDGETLARMLCDCFTFSNSADEEEFRAYSKENFSSLSNSVMKELYRNPKNNTLRLKKSGYIGSHALGTAFVAALLQLSSNDKYLNQDLSLWREYVEKFRNSIFEQYKNVISVLGSEYAQVNIDKIDYYGTTMAGVFFRENEDSVDAIFLNCGDSRSYIWDSNGFRQACDDQGRNGGMTSRFSFGKNVSHNISFEERNYKKPCSIFCMTDGVYSIFGGKNGFHSTPLYMEGFLMNVLSSATSIKDLSSKLKVVFDKNGQIDDSNSMVMAAFGYNCYDELKMDAKKHMDNINQKYCLKDKPDDFLIVDYKKIVLDLQKASKDSIKELLNEAYDDEKVHSYCVKQIVQAHNGRNYNRNIGIIDDKISSFIEKNNNIRKKLYVIVKENFIDFEDIESVDQSLLIRLKNNVQGTRLKDAKKYGRAFLDDCYSRAEDIDGLVEEIELLKKTITEKNDSLAIGDEQVWSKETEEDTGKWIDTIKGAIKETSKCINDRLAKIADYSKRITDDCEKWKIINKTLMNDYLNNGGEVSPQMVVDSWLEDALVIEEAVVDTTIPSTRFEIIKLVKQYHENCEEIEQLNVERNQAVEQAARYYWEDNCCKDIHELLNNELFFQTNSLVKKKIIDRLNENKELTNYQDLYQSQIDIFERYLKSHLSDTSEDKISDVKKYGWM